MKKNSEKINIHWCIHESFFWRLTEEGFDYWDQIYVDLLEFSERIAPHAMWPKRKRNF